jgi:hypothetical protein
MLGVGRRFAAGPALPALKSAQSAGKTSQTARFWLDWSLDIGREMTKMAVVLSSAVQADAAAHLARLAGRDSAK